MKYRNVDGLVFKLIIFGIASTMALGGVLIAPVLPMIEADFSGVPHIDFLSKMLITLPSLAMVIFAPITGFAMHKFGKLNVLFVGMLIWSLGGAVGFFINDIYLLLISRIVFGIGQAALTVGVPVLIGDYYSGEKKDKALGFMSFSQVMGGAVFMIVSGQLGRFGWHYSFLVYFIEIFVLLAAFFVLFEPQRHIETANNNLNNNINFKKFLLPYFIGFLLFTIFFIAPIQTPFLLTEFFHKDSKQIGLIVGSMIAVSGISPLVYAWLKARLSVFMIFFISCLIMGIGLNLMGVSSSVYIVIIGGMMAGSSFSIIMVNNVSYLFSLASSFERSRAYGILGALISLGMFVSPILSTAVLKVFGLKEAYMIYGSIMVIFGFFFIFQKNSKKSVS